MGFWNESEEARVAACATWIRVDGQPDAFAASIASGQTAFVHEDPRGHAEAMGARLLVPGTEDFPDRVVAHIDPCGPWFVRGALPTDAPRLAVVGTRAVDAEGTRLTKSIVGDLAAAGVTIVSGGAIGVDTLAHEAALAAGGRTVAILPAALDVPTPSRNRALFARIAARGAVVSEYPSRVAARKHHFHRRNRLIAAYADAVLVVRAQAKGGTMITANAAIDLGTPLLVVPGSPEDATAAGCNALLRRGARCVTSAAEVLEELGITRAVEVVGPHRGVVSDEAARMLAALGDGPRTLDELCALARLPITAALVALTELEVAGRVELRGGRYATRRPGQG